MSKEVMGVQEVSPGYEFIAENPAVPVGYKQTEVGVIPEGWEIFPFGEHFSIYAGGDAPKHSLSSTQSDRHPYPVFANAIQGKGLYGFTAETRSKPDSVTVTARGYLGHAEYRSEPFFPIVRLLVLEPKGTLDSKYTSYAINDRVQFSIESTGVPQLTAPQVARYAVAAPSDVKEQKAIATVLSDVDALLEELDRLIAKKRDIKQAAMQQLLTGETRLPGFEGEWITVRASDIGRFRGGSGFPTRFQGCSSGAYPFLKVSDMNNAGNETFIETANHCIDEPVRKQIGAAIFPSGTIIFAKVGAAIFLERKKILTMPSCIDNNMTGYVLDSEAVDVRFIHYAMLRKNLGDLVSTTALPSLSGSALSSIEFSIPPLEEQVSIATVLSDMDAEIQALEKRRSKTAELKQGMMQELLTGRTRLV